MRISFGRKLRTAVLIWFFSGVWPENAWRLLNSGRWYLEKRWFLQLLLRQRIGFAEDIGQRGVLRCLFRRGLIYQLLQKIAFIEIAQHAFQKTGAVFTNTAKQI